MSAFFFSILLGMGGGDAGTPTPTTGLYLFRRVRDGAALAFRTV